MSRRTLLPVLLTPIVIVLLGAATTATGNAEAQPGGAPWPGATICAEGTLDFADIDPDGIHLAGSIQPCAGTDPGAVAGVRWGVAQYRTQGAFIFENGIRHLDPATTPFEARIDTYDLLNGAWGPLQAACLITAPKVRLACVAITTEWNGAMQIAPIPVSDPLVSRLVTIVRDDPPDPECGACV
jgi:hypothetical protein